MRRAAAGITAIYAAGLLDHFPKDESQHVGLDGGIDSKCQAEQHVMLASATVIAHPGSGLRTPPPLGATLSPDA
jgi:hypothetical protein